MQSPSKLLDYANSGRAALNINTNIKLDTKKIDDFLDGNSTNSLKIENIEQYDIKKVLNQFLVLTS